MKLSRELLLLGLILLGSAILRFLWLERVPIGWVFDESLMGVMASEIYHGTNRPIFFTGFHGNEALYPYLGALMIWLMGGDQGVMPFRILSATSGLATVVLTYLLGRELYDRRVGLIAAALIGSSFWQVMSSRSAYRSILQPITEAIAVYCLWRGMRTKSVWWWAGSGAAIGATLYTYLGGRAFPAVFLGFGIWAVVFVGRPSARTVGRVALLAGVAALVLAPLAGFFLLNPGTFWTRLQMVSVMNPAAGDGGHPVMTLLGNVGKFLGIFTFAGDPFWRYNVPFRPVFIWLIAPFFYLGFAVVLLRFARRDATSALMLAWLSVMSLPSVLSVDVGGYWLRAMAVVPAVYLLPALGMTAAWDWIWLRVADLTPRARGADLTPRARGADLTPRPPSLEGKGERLKPPREFADGPLFRLRRIRVRVPGYSTETGALPGRAWPLQPLAVAVVAGIVLFDGITTFHDYFNRWAPSFGAAYETDLHVRDQAEHLQATANPSSEETFAGSDYFGHPIIAQLAPRVYGGLRWFDGSLSFVYSPQSEKPSRYVLNLRTLPDDVDHYLPREALVDTRYYPVGLEGNPPPPSYVDYRLTSEQVREQVDRWLNSPTTRRALAQFGNQIELLGSQYQTFARAGETHRVEVGWRVLSRSDGWSYAMFAHLVDGSGRRWVQRDANGYPPPGWRQGDVILGRLDLKIPANVPSGRYWIVTGVYDRETLLRLEGVSDGQPVSEVRLGTLRVIGSPSIATARSDARVTPDRAVDARLAGGIVLRRTGWTGSDGKLDVAIEWSTAATLEQDYTVFIQLLDGSGKLVAQSDSEPQGGNLPTSLWLPDESISDAHRLDVSKLPAGRYHLIAGMYHLATGQRLSLTSGGDFVTLGEVEVP